MTKIIPHPRINAGVRRLIVRSLNKRLIAIRNTRLSIGMELPFIASVLTRDERREYAEAFRLEAAAALDIAEALDSVRAINPAGEAPFFLDRF